MYFLLIISVLGMMLSKWPVDAMLPDSKLCLVGVAGCGACEPVPCQLAASAQTLVCSSALHFPPEAHSVGSQACSHSGSTSQYSWVKQTRHFKVLRQKWSNILEVAPGNSGGSSRLVIRGSGVLSLSVCMPVDIQDILTEKVCLLTYM